MKYTQLVLVEFRNCAPFVYKFVSEKHITYDRVVQYFVDVDDFNQYRDNITFLDEFPEFDLDVQRVVD